jgi:hypothetical protein
MNEDTSELLDDARSIRLIEEFVKTSQKEGNEFVANCLMQLIETISSIGVRNLQPHKPIETEILKSIEKNKWYYLSTVQLRGENPSYESAVFLCDREGVVECWMPLETTTSKLLHEAQEDRRKIKMKAESGSFDRIDPWNI